MLNRGDSLFPFPIHPEIRYRVKLPPFLKDFEQHFEKEQTFVPNSNERFPPQRRMFTGMSTTTSATGQNMVQGGTSRGLGSSNFYRRVVTEQSNIPHPLTTTMHTRDRIIYIPNSLQTGREFINTPTTRHSCRELIFVPAKNESTVVSEQNVGTQNNNSGISQLPINACKETLINMVRQNQVLIVVGETGTGKTTQIPQILEKAGFASNGLIGCTNPRSIKYQIKFTTYNNCNLKKAHLNFVKQKISEKF